MNNDWIAVGFMVLAIAFAFAPVPDYTVTIATMFAAALMVRGDDE